MCAISQINLHAVAVVTLQSRQVFANTFLEELFEGKK
jgi:hypothetical protein